MKYIYCVVIYDVIGDFNEIPGGIIANNQPFIDIIFQQLFVEWVPQGITDIFFYYTMLILLFIQNVTNPRPIG